MTRLWPLALPALAGPAGAFLALAVIYLLTAPANHALSVDAYAYATDITEGVPWVVEQPRQMLWVAAMQGIFRSVSLIQPGVDPFAVVGFVNVLATALAMALLPGILTRHLDVAEAPAWLSTGILAASYGVWRYASEVEVYAVAICLAVLLIRQTLLATPDNGRLRTALLAVFGALATLTYQPLGLLAGFAVPIYLALRSGLLSALTYWAVSGVVVAAGYAGAFLLSDAPDLAGFVLESDELSPSRPGILAAAEIVYAIGHDLLSTNWTFAFAPIRDFYASAAPDRFFAEEIYAAKNAGFVVWAPLVTLPLALFAAGALIRRAVAQHVGRLTAAEAFFLGWLALHTAMMAVLSPAGFEGWIIALLPIAALATRRLIAPAMAAGGLRWAALLLLVFVVHNGLAGVGLLARPGTDYLAARGDAVLEKARPGDLIVVASDWSLYKYLDYKTAADVIRVRSVDGNTAVDAIQAAQTAGGAVFVFDDVSDPPGDVRHARPDLMPVLSHLTETYLVDATPMDTGDAGRAFVMAGSRP